MGTHTGASTPAEGGWLTNMCRWPGNAFLAAAKAAGRATRISQDGASMAARAAVHVATRSASEAVRSVKWLSALHRTKRPAHEPRADYATPAAAVVPAASPAADIPQDRTSAPPSSPAKGPDRVGVASVSKPQRKPRPAEARRARVGGTRGDAIPSDVTPAEATAAPFAGVSEKVVFARTLKELASPDEATRARAAAILGASTHKSAVKALAARLADDRSAVVRKECVNALTALGSRDGLPAVERALADSCSMVRLAAVRSVYRLAGPAGASLLVRMLSDEDEGVRRRAAVCIGWLRRPELASELRPLLHGPSAWVRLAALEALQSLRSPAAVDDVIALLDDPEESVRRRAFQTLQTITGRRMGETYPEDEPGRQFVIARWRAWREEQRERGWAPSG